MPPINKYKCNCCDFSFPDGWGGYFYVEVDEDLLRRRLLEVEGQLSNLYKDLENVKVVLEEVKGKILEDINLMEKLLNEMKPRVEKVLRKAQSVIDEIKYRRTHLRLRDTTQHFELEVMRLKETIFETGDRLIVNLREGVRSYFESYFNELTRLLEEEKRDLEHQLQALKDTWHNLKSENLRVLRVKCPHPSEHMHAEIFLGRETYREQAKSRCGFNSHAICLDCLYKFEADFRDEKVNEWRFWYGFPSFKEAFRGKPSMKDERKCPKCGSTRVKTVFEMIGEKCPKCGVGIIEEIETGIMV